MSVTQTDFTRAILDPNLTVPNELVDPEGRPAGARFSVYRNNVAASLTEALGAAFPTIKKLVGDAFFDAMAGIYLRKFPPHSPLMMHYGQDMPSFLETFEPVGHLGFLPDVARLELGMRQSYHAADHQSFDASQLARIAPEKLMASRMTFAPSVVLIHSNWPLYGIWAANMAGGPKPEAQAESVLILRQEFDPTPNKLSKSDAACMASLLEGADLGQAIDDAGEGFDLSPLLGLLLAQGAITGISER